MAVMQINGAIAEIVTKYWIELEFVIILLSRYFTGLSSCFKNTLQFAQTGSIFNFLNDPIIIVFAGLHCIE